MRLSFLENFAWSLPRRATWQWNGWRLPGLRFIRGGVVAVLLLASTLWVCDRLFPLPMGRLHDLSVVVVDRDGTPLRVLASHARFWRLATESKEVDPSYINLLLAIEDKRFFQHSGVDAQAVLRAIGQNLLSGRIVSGASTLTMQVVRLLEPHPRSLSAKLLEMARALQLETHYDKTTILGMYLTLAPFGGTIEGVRAATWAYFGKSPRELSTAEAALLVALPQAPSRLRPNRSEEKARLARNKVLTKAVTAGALPDRLAEEATLEPLPTRLHPFPTHAYHLAEALRARHPGATTITSTIDYALQCELEDLARREQVGLVEHGGLAILLVGNKQGNVLAYLGAPNFHDDSRDGWVDMTQAVRSPGSTLKPFIYGMGFEDRVIHPETLVADVSTQFGDYAPANFDRSFHGELTIREALQQSLNIPAVLVLDRVGPMRFTERLRHVGARLVFPVGTKEPGLPVALGGASISLWDLTSLYLGLSHAQNGTVIPLRVEPETVAPVPNRLLSVAAATTVRRILEGTAPPPGLLPAGEISRRPAIAFKTGTSYGFRDAWAFGVSVHYTVGVWVGRPDGTPSPDHYGRNTAAPLLYRVFDLLAEGQGQNDSGREATSLEARHPPPLLRRIRAGDSEYRPLTLSDSEQLRLVFPTEGVVLEREDGSLAPLTFTASGGRRPLTWVINGRPLAVTETKRETSWTPEGPGFSRITVIDADGRSASAHFQLQ